MLAQDCDEANISSTTMYCSFSTVLVKSKHRRKVQWEYRNQEMSIAGRYASNCIMTYSTHHPNLRPDDNFRPPTPKNLYPKPISPKA